MTQLTRIKTWALLQSTFNEADCIWCKGLGVNVIIDRPTHTFDTVHGTKHTIAGKPSIKLESTTDKQEQMLQLKYSGSLLLMMDEYMLPGVSRCTLSGINWNGN